MASLNKDGVSDNSDSSEQGITFYGASSASDAGYALFQANLPYASPESGIIATIHSSSVSTGSTGSHHHFTPSNGSVLSFSPHASAPLEPGDILSSTSGLNDSISDYSAQRVPSAPRASPVRQIAHCDFVSSSAEGTRLEEPASQSTERVVVTPATSTTSNASEDVDIWGLGQGHHRYPAGIANRNASLIGLNLPEPYQNRPSFCDPNDENDAGILEFVYSILGGKTRLQDDPDGPWTAWPGDGRSPGAGELALAPPTGPAFDEYHLRTNKYTYRYQKIQRQRRQKTILGRSGSSNSCHGSARGTPGYPRENSPRVTTQWSSAYNELRGAQSQNYHDWQTERFSGILQQHIIPRSVDSVTYSVETQVSIFHPSFLVSHLSRSSVLTLTQELYAPKDLAYDVDHPVAFDLGFGSLINLDVCPFTPRDKRALRSYQKHEGEEALVVQESLPIVLNLFSLEVHAKELNVWLDGIIDSEFGLLKPVDLMVLREKDAYLSRVLGELFSWYMASKNQLPELEYEVLRPALKLLMTTTLMNLVPTVADLPAPLSDYLSSQFAQDDPYFSFDAPRLLTRQIKASIHYLQQQLLGDIFYHLSEPLPLKLDVEIALVFLVAYVLDLVRNAGHLFAKYEMEFNSTATVTNHDVEEYENMQALLFQIVRASVRGRNGRRGALAERLRSLDSSVKGKGKESDEHQFVRAILTAVL